jgi:hypothetical protein
LSRETRNTTLQHEVFALESKPKQKGVEEEGSIIKARVLFHLKYKESLKKKLA